MHDVGTVKQEDKQQERLSQNRTLMNTVLKRQKNRSEEEEEE